MAAAMAASAAASGKSVEEQDARALEEMLQRFKLQDVLAALRDYGISCVEDLRELEPDEVQELNIPPMAKKKMVKVMMHLEVPSFLLQQSQAPTPTSAPPPPVIAAIPTTPQVSAPQLPQEAVMQPPTGGGGPHVAPPDPQLQVPAPCVQQTPPRRVSAPEQVDTVHDTAPVSAPAAVSVSVPAPVPLQPEASASIAAVASGSQEGFLSPSRSVTSSSPLAPPLSPGFTPGASSTPGPPATLTGSKDSEDGAPALSSLLGPSSSVQSVAGAPPLDEQEQVEPAEPEAGDENQASAPP